MAFNPNGTSYADSRLNQYVSSFIAASNGGLPVAEPDPSSPTGYSPTVSEPESTVDNPNNISDIYNYAYFLHELEDKAIKDQQDFNLASAKTAMEFSASEAKKTRDWQEYMSNTAYQRAMTDLRKAGLNPILAYTQGSASTPAGSTGTGYSTSSAKAEYSHENITKELFSLLTNTAVQYARINTEALTGILRGIGSIIPG